MQTLPKVEIHPRQQVERSMVPKTRPDSIPEMPILLSFFFSSRVARYT